LRAEYEKDINSMMEHHRTEIEDMDHLFKEEMEEKTRQYVELMQKHHNMT
jgi:hypothetical protein